LELKRVKDIGKDFPVKVQTLYRWHHEGRFPKLIKKFGGALCIDLDEIPNVLKERDIPLRKVKPTM
jgi:hypothetical protein